MTKSVEIRKASAVSKEERFQIAKTYLAMNDKQNIKEYHRLMDLRMKHPNGESNNPDDFDEIDLRMELLMYCD